MLETLFHVLSILVLRSKLEPMEFLFFCRVVKFVMLTNLYMSAYCCRWCCVFLPHALPFMSYTMWTAALTDDV